MNQAHYISKNIKMPPLFAGIAFFLVFALSSCIVVKYESSEGDGEAVTVIELSPKPEIPISRNVMITNQGDLIAFIPEEWFFVEAAPDSASPIIAMAVNPDYSLGLVLTGLPRDNNTAEAFELEGIAGIGKLSFGLHQAKAGAGLKLAGRMKTTTIGGSKFCLYDMVLGGGRIGKTAVLVTDSYNYYEITLITMDVKEKPIPSEAEIDKIFNSILTTVVY